MSTELGIVMTDPADRRRTVFVRHADVEGFAARGYTAVDSETQRKPRPVPTSAPSEAAPPAEQPEQPEQPTPTPSADATPEAPAAPEQPEAAPAAPAVTFPRRARRSTAAD